MPIAASGPFNRLEYFSSLIADENASVKSDRITTLRIKLAAAHLHITGIVHLSRKRTGLSDVIRIILVDINILRAGGNPHIIARIRHSGIIISPAICS